MKLLHLSDLHIGKRLGEYSLAEDHKYILNQICEIAEAERVDAVVIAGDIYDKSAPSGESVAIFDEFLTNIASPRRPALIISGNHDSPERVSYAGRLLRKSNVFTEGENKKEMFRAEIGGTEFYLMPFIRPAYVREFFPDKNIESYNDAVRLVTEQLRPSKRSVLIAHQFVTAKGFDTERTESEIVSVGGQDNIDAALFSKFSYTALGHLHKAQCVGGINVRYCGSPLKYSKSEARDEKSVTVAEIGERVSYKAIPLRPLRDVRAMRGNIDNIIKASKGQASEDYVYITLTDDKEIMDAAGRLREVYPNFVRIDFENKRTENNGVLKGIEGIRGSTPEELFGKFYYEQNGEEMSEKERAVIQELIGGEEL